MTRVATWLLGAGLLLTVATGWVLAVDGGDYTGVRFAALVAGTATAAAAAMALDRGRLATAAALGAVTAVLVPTYFVYLANVVLLVTAIAVLVGAARRRNRVASGSGRPPG